MNRLNNKLLSVFLSFGILFFIGLTYLFVKDEIVPSVKKEKSDLTHRLVINKINIVKNDYFDGELNTSLNVDDGMQVGTSEVLENDVFNFVLINSKDGYPNVKSQRFILKKSKAPTTIDFNYESSIPNSTFKDRFILVLEKSNNSEIYTDTFEVGLLQSVFNLDEKNHQRTIEHDIKLESKNHKMVIYLNVSVDSYGYGRVID